MAEVKTESCQDMAMESNACYGMAMSAAPMDYASSNEVDELQARLNALDMDSGY